MRTILKMVKRAHCCQHLSQLFVFVSDFMFWNDLKIQVQQKLHKSVIVIMSLSPWCNRWVLGCL